MGSTPSTAHRLEICRAKASAAFYFRIARRIGQTSASSDKSSQQWAVRQVQPIASRFAERKHLQPSISESHEGIRQHSFQNHTKDKADICLLW